MTFDRNHGSRGLAERFAAGDGLGEIAREFRLDPSLVEGVLQWEMARTQDASAA